MTYTKKVLICYSRAGGGHEAMAHMIKKALGETCDVVTYNIGTKNKFLDTVLSHGYVWLTEKVPFLWTLLSVLWKLPVCMYITRYLLKLSSGTGIKNQLSIHDPDMVVSTYYFISNIAKKYNPAIPAYTVVSDIFAIQPIWFYDKTEKYMVMSDTSYQLARTSGIPDENIFLCNPAFDSKYEQYPTGTELAQCKELLKIPETSRIRLLVIGGGSSIPRGYQLVRNLLQISHPCELYIVCGRNKKLQEKVTLLAQQNNNPNIHIHVLGFVHHIRELISISDIIISKAGPGIMLESLSLHKPMMIYHYIWEQEKPNMEFIVKNKFGIYEHDFKKLVSKINYAITHPESTATYAKNISEYRLHNGLPEIIAHIKTSFM